MPYSFDHSIKRYQLREVLQRLYREMYKPLAELKVTAWHTAEPVPFGERTSGKKLALKVGDKWGDLFDCAWFNFTGVVPKEAAGRHTVLLLDVNGELCVVDKAGNPLRGLTCKASGYDYSLGEPVKRVLQFKDKAKGGEAIDVWADAGCNDLFGVLQGNGALREAHVAICNDELRALLYDFEVLHELMAVLPETTARYQQILYALAQVTYILRDYTEAEAREARRVLAPELTKKGGDPSLTITAIGHAHIDLAWLWPVRETIRKGARTFATVLDLMDRYPDYIYGQSQPQIYQWMKDEYPALYRRMKKKVAEGRWEPQGGMWVEADTNVSGGEALVRQFLYGKRFFRDEFGWEAKSLWLPDVFGYSAALPQIMKKAGVPWFMTQKLSWDRFNKYPHQTFIWEGLDGTRVLAHLPPEETYNSSAAPRALHKSEENYRDKAVSDRCLVLFGIGDGGGGPGAEHLERLAREKNLAGLPPTAQEISVKLFEHLEKGIDRYETWAGELYLACHQGTYTTQARNKRFNRKMELALRDAELATVMAGLYARTKTPAQKFEMIWREVLLYQFHDILPGSSITRVYTESLARYAELMKETVALTAGADGSVVNQINTEGMKKPHVAFNSLSWPRREWMQVGRQWRKVSVPALGYAAFDLAVGNNAEPVPAMTASESTLENELLRVRFGKDGAITSVFDKESGREALAPRSEANVLTVYHDEGDAWDFTIDYDKTPAGRFSLESSAASVDGPQARLRQVRRFGNSRLEQEIVLTAGSRRLDFITKVDWKESSKMLRVAFPVDVRATAGACEIQFGHLMRANNRNTTWEQSRYEVPAHKWVDLSDAGYGVALMNDCKYGYKLLGNVLDLNLLRSPHHPDPVADVAEHEFTYALYPHASNLVAGGVVRAGYELNVPLRVVPVEAAKGLNAGKDAKLPIEKSLLTVEGDGVVVEAVKQAEDGDALIVRLYEAFGAKTKATVRFGFAAKSVSLVDLMEENPQTIKMKDNAVDVAFGPFEIQTIRVVAK